MLTSLYIISSQFLSNQSKTSDNCCSHIGDVHLFFLRRGKTKKKSDEITTFSNLEIFRLWLNVLLEEWEIGRVRGRMIGVSLGTGTAIF